MQALDLADGGTFLYSMFVVTMDFAPLLWKLKKKQSGCECVCGAIVI